MRVPQDSFKGVRAIGKISPKNWIIVVFYAQSRFFLTMDGPFAVFSTLAYYSLSKLFGIWYPLLNPTNRDFFAYPSNEPSVAMVLNLRR